MSDDIRKRKPEERTSNPLGSTVHDDIGTKFDGPDNVPSRSERVVDDERDLVGVCEVREGANVGLRSTNKGD